MEIYTYPRTGSRPLQFRGEILARIDTSGHNSTRWFEAELARTKGGSYVVAVTYRSQWEKERDLSFAHHGTDDDITEWLKDFNPMQGVLGIPSGVQNWVEKQNRLEFEIRKSWSKVVSALCSEFGPEIID